MSRIAIIGAGAWGTALAIVAGRKSSHQVRLWAYEREVRDSIGDHGENSLFLTGHRIPNSVSVTGDFAEALSGAKIVVSAVPSQHCRRIVEQMAPHLTSEMFLISAAKGLEASDLTSHDRGDRPNHRQSVQSRSVEWANLRCRSCARRPNCNHNRFRG